MAGGEGGCLPSVHEATGPTPASHTQVKKKKKIKRKTHRHKPQNKQASLNVISSNRSVAAHLPGPTLGRVLTSQAWLGTEVADPWIASLIHANQHTDPARGAVSESQVCERE